VEREKHPSYGVIGLSRISHGMGRNLLFGSHLDRHQETVELRIYRASRMVESTSHEWFYADDRGSPIAIVELSPAQFAQLLTTMNVGDGVPCTIRNVDGESIPNVPNTYESEQEKIYRGFQESIFAKLNFISPALKELDEILSKKTIKRADRDRIRELTIGLFDNFKSNTSYVLKNFEESAEKVVTAAKAQVDEFVTSTLIRAGMDSLRGNFEHSGFLGTRKEEGE